MSRSRGIGGSLVFVLILAMPGCGGGGGGAGPAGTPPAGGTGSTGAVTGNGLAPSTGPGDIQSYAPDAQGNIRSFNYVTNDTTALSSAGVVHVATNGTRVVNGVTGTVFTRSDPTLASGGYDQYFAFSSGGVSLLGNSDSSDSLTPLITPYAELLFPVQTGTVSSLTGTSLPFGKDSAGHAITVNLTQTITNVGFENVDVPAGSFSNVLRQMTAINATAQDSGQNSPPISANQVTWFAPGVGEIREQIDSSSNGVNLSSAAELRGYLVNGVRHGLGEAASALPSLATTGCRGSATNGWPRLASNGTLFVAVVHTCDGSSGTPKLKWVAVFLQTDGTPQRSVDLSAAVSNSAGYGLHATIAFDGANYLVVYEDDASVNTFGNANLEAVLLSPTGTVLAGPNVVGASTSDLNYSGDVEALAFDGNRYLLTYSDNNATARPPQLSGLFISRTTAQADGTPFAISSTNASPHPQPAMAFDGTNYLVVWNELGSNPAGLRATRVSPSGGVLDSPALLVMDNSANVMSSSCCDLEDLLPAVSFDGTNYLVTYRDTRGAPGYSGQARISAARVSPAGVLLDGTATTPGITVTTLPGVVVGSLRTAYVNGAHWIVWSSGALSPTALLASRVSVSGQVPSVWPNGFSLVAPAGTAVEQWPAITAAASGGLITWVELPAAQADAGATLQGLPVYP